jgi:hypothetical protein
MPHSFSILRKLTVQAEQVRFLLPCKSERGILLMILRQVMSHGLFTNINLIIYSQGGVE